METVFEISNALEGKETGFVPQVVFEDGILDTDTLRKIKRFSVSDFKLQNVRLPNLILNMGSRRTDWLNTFSLSAGRGKLISEKFYLLLAKLKLPAVDFLRVNLVEGSSLHLYYYLNIDDTEMAKYIDFSKSSFCLAPGGKRVKINGRRDYEKITAENPGYYIEWTHLHLIEDVFLKYDVVKFGFGKINWYVRGSLIDDLKQITGIEVREVADSTFTMD